MVSVVIPCYNQSAWLNEAIDSVLASTYKDVEIIVVDDGSRDRVVVDDRDGRVRLIAQENQGVCMARNRAIRESCGEYILTLDADDRIHPDFIRRAVGILDSHADMAQVGGNYVLLEGEKVGPPVIKGSSGRVLDYIMANNFMPNAYLFRKTAWERVGGFSPSLNRLAIEDVDFSMKIHTVGLGAYWVVDVACLYRQHGESRNNHRFRRIRAKVDIVCRLWRWYVRHPGYMLAFLCWNRFGFLVSGGGMTSEDNHGY